MQTDQDTGRGLASARRAAGVSQAELARRVGTTQSAIARLETGALSPSVRTLGRVYQALGLQLVIVAEPTATERPAPPPPVIGRTGGRRNEVLARLRASRVRVARSGRANGGVARLRYEQTAGNAALLAAALIELDARLRAAADEPYVPDPWRLWAGERLELTTSVGDVDLEAGKETSSRS